MEDKKKECELYPHPDMSCYDYPEQCINCPQKVIDMTQENKELLFKDLSSRVFYHVKIFDRKFKKDIATLTSSFNSDPYNTNLCVGLDYSNNCHRVANIEDIKPYLRSLKNMTEKEKEEFQSFQGINIGDPVGFIDWLIKHYFDYRGLIPSGLALEAPEGMYEIK